MIFQASLQLRFFSLVHLFHTHVGCLILHAQMFDSSITFASDNAKSSHLFPLSAVKENDGV